ncbi:MAG: hydrogenase nickel incorporation protein HypB [Burkholderiales bacterium]|nr:hydrogenase nickel incorporation protein HypB [Burkholderiales bacterium]
MCISCGCGSEEAGIGREADDHARMHAAGAIHRHDHAAAQDLPHDHGHEHQHESVPEHAHAPGLAPARMLRIEQDILAKNDSYAAQNRRILAERGILALNLVSSPGAGKTALLVKTIEALGDRCRIGVIEGDQQTSHDADRIRATGARAVQINTGRGCHLDAHMVGHAIAQLDPPHHGMLMIENVGNLVCPAAFDLGEAHKVVVLSVTEGEDKPLKYPDMFRRASLMLLNKIDLLPYLEFDLALCIDYAHRTNPDLAVICVSALTGEGIPQWLAWLDQGAESARAACRDIAALSGCGPDEPRLLVERGLIG